MNPHVRSENIAIIGMACLFPGAASPAAFWDNLVNGINASSLAGAAQFGVDPAVYYDPQRRTHDTTYALRGGFIHTPIPIPPGMDKAGGWALYTAREALHDSGYADRVELFARCGLILGNLSFPTQESHNLIAPLYDTALENALGDLLGRNDFRLSQAHRAPSGFEALRSPAAAVAEALGLGGTHFCLDAACASSLYAVELASAYLRTGQADLMLAGAVSAADPLFVNMGFTHFGAYPDQGASRPLDTHSEGLIAGEGAGMLILKRYADAVRDGDRIYAIVAGAGLSNDGRGKHPLTPNSRGQILAFQRAYSDQIDPAAVQYIECHASGTPLGDKTELQSMDEFFGGAAHMPLIGSVKANHGHLLTVAGLASLLKVILSMGHAQIPATIGIEHPLTSRYFGAAQIVRANTPWPQPVKTAGVNAFGFGGVSAHLIVQNPAAAGAPEPAPQPAEKPRLAIVGMDAHFGRVEGLEAFAQTLYDGGQHFIPLPPKRWKGLAENAPNGAYIESFEIDFLRFKFPPKDDDQPTPQHLLLLKVADNAVQDAGLREDANVAVIVVLGTELSLHQYRSRLDLSWQMKDSLQAHGFDLAADADDLERTVKDAISPPAQVNQYTSYIGNIVSSRVSALWNFSGPAFTMTAAENSVYKALEVAQILLTDLALEAVVIGAVDLAGGVEQVELRRAQHPINSGTPTLSFDRHADGWMVGEGAGAVVLKRAADAADQQVYARLESVIVRTGHDAEAVNGAARAALAEAGIDAGQVGVVEASASGIAAEDAAEIAGLTRAYTRQAQPFTTALSSVKVNIGHTGAAAGMASLIKAALCLQRRFIPGVPRWTAPHDPAAWHESAFYVTDESRTWFSPRGQPRHAALNGLSDDGTCAHVILSDHGVKPKTSADARYLARKAFYLFPVDADDRETLIGRLRALHQAIQAGEPLAQAAHDTFARYGGGRYAAAIVGRDRDMLIRELDQALKGIPAAFDKGTDWYTPAGSAFSAAPLGAGGGIAFVYPGAFNSYPGHGRDWLHLFPTELDQVAAQSADLGDQVSERLLYPRTLAAPDRAAIREQRARLTGNPRAMMESGTVFSVLYTHVMRQIFKVQPHVTFGYSLGETSMLWAMDVWRDTPKARALLHESPLFHHRLAGRKDAVREAWGLPAHAGDEFWVSYVIAAPAPAVIDEIAQETRVYLTHINTPKECVIAGEPGAVERVIARLGGEAVRAPFETVIHNDTITSEYAAFYHLYHQRVHDSAGSITFYSAADYEPLRLEDDLVARSMARVSCKQIDFPRLIQRAYRDGARIFIELGPGSTCTRWISDTLRMEGREHLAVSIDTLRLDDHTALIKMLAKLVSHRVPLDLACLYASDAPAVGRRLPRTITLGGEPIQSVILSDENRRRFGSGDTTIPHEPPAAVPELDAMPALAAQGDHAALLGTRLAALRQFGAALIAQVQNPGALAERPPIPAVSAPAAPRFTEAPKVRTRYTPRPALFSTADIDQFARGSIKACFGPEYAIYDDKRAPRIPNTDLMLISRIVEIDAERLVTRTGSGMTAEYDVPADLWFYRDQPYPFTPYSMLMEMALQPCGFLSAYMGPTLDFPDIDFYFRNLDGQGKLLREVDLRGRTLVNRVRLLSSTILQGIIIQKYGFDMMLDGDSFYVGSSTFGYFTLQALSSQAGLDMGKPPTRWHQANPSAALIDSQPPHSPAADSRHWMALPVGQLAFLDEALIDVRGGKHGLGYIYGVNHVQPSKWYFKCHFHDDPVMPGSLGLETVTQAIQAFALQANLQQGMVAPRFGLVEDHQMVWKYRGQVLGESDAVHVEVHIVAVERQADDVVIRADASLWKDALRIYEFKNVGVRVTDTPIP
ncbi:MAG: PfaB family protein [bacterium]|nr:PfaB family protein [bacterium]